MTTITPTYDDLAERVTQLEIDIALIGKRLHEEATKRGWCSDYDTFVTDVNTQLVVAQLPGRPIKYEVAVHFDVHVHYEIEAATEEAARVEASHRWGRLRESELFNTSRFAGEEADRPHHIDWTQVPSESRYEIISPREN